MKIGSLDVKGNVFLAPMAGITDAAFRKTVQRFGISALWTEMISSESLVRSKAVRSAIDIYDHNVPTIFQLSGHKPSTMAGAARISEQLGAAAIDLNMGCPAKKMVHRGGGVALMRTPVIAAEIVRHVRKCVKVPVTVKMRSGWDDTDDSAPEFARMLESEGADAIIIHSRPKSRRHSGPVDHDLIRNLKETLSIPVIGNGGICDYASANAMLNESGCDGIMIGRGALGKPWLPGRILSQLLGWSDTTEVPVLDVIKQHLNYQLEFRDNVHSLKVMRKHFAWYSKDLPNGTEFRRQVFTLESEEAVIDLLDGFFGKVSL